MNGPSLAVARRLHRFRTLAKRVSAGLTLASIDPTHFHQLEARWTA